MFRSFSNPDAPAPGSERISAWTRERFGLDAGDAIVVTELASAVPGCPPLETVVAFWTADGQRHCFKVFKPADQVLPDDLPPAWMKPGLAVADGYSCDCC